VSAEPREPTTVEKRTKTGVFRAGSFRNPAFVYCESGSYTWKKPCAPAPRAWTTRSGMRSWSKRVIFSRRWKSSSSEGPRGPGFSESSVCSIRTPWSVVRNVPSGSSRFASRSSSLVGLIGSSARDGCGLRCGARPWGGLLDELPCFFFFSAM
jgi:hypothetical protein